LVHQAWDVRGEVAPQREGCPVIAIFLAAIDAADQPADHPDAVAQVSSGNLARHRGSVGRLEFHVGVDEMDERAVADSIDDLVAISTGAAVFRIPQQPHVGTELTYDVDAVVGGGIVENENSLVALGQQLRNEFAQMPSHVVVGDGGDDRHMWRHQDGTRSANVVRID
jgi:hypothetical protein